LRLDNPIYQSKRRTAKRRKENCDCRRFAAEEGEKSATRGDLGLPQVPALSSGKKVLQQHRVFLKHSILHRSAFRIPDMKITFSAGQRAIWA